MYVWSKTFHCKGCRKPRPWVVRAESGECLICVSRKRLVKRYAATYHTSRQTRQERAIVKAKNAYSQAQRINEHCVYGPIEGFVPIYEMAVDANCFVRHIEPIRPTAYVCGLHVPANLEIVPFKGKPKDLEVTEDYIILPPSDEPTLNRDLGHLERPLSYE